LRQSAALFVEQMHDGADYRFTVVETKQEAPVAEVSDYLDSPAVDGCTIHFDLLPLETGGLTCVFRGAASRFHRGCFGYGTAMQQANERHSLATYVSDMLALERHIRIPFDTQNADRDFDCIGNASHLVIRLATTSDDHIEQLEGCLATLGGHEAAGIKNAISQLEGFVAGAIDKSRKTKVSKALRDDYTALALCCAGYAALLATANAMDETSVAAVAGELLEDYAGLTMDIAHALPEIVVQELASIGLDVNVSTASDSERQIEHAWRMKSRARDQWQNNTHGTIGATDGAFAETTLADS
jgi:hypothetical protein